MRHKGVVWTVAAVVVAGGATTVVLEDHAKAPIALSKPATGTAKVVRTDLVTTVPMFGQLGYSSPVTVLGTTGGRAYTWLPAAGSVIAQGETLYEVDGRAVPLLAGDRPVWRAVAVGTPAGPDIAALNSDLVTLGYAHGIGGDTRFTSATAAAVRRWQRARGVPVTGRVELGDFVFGQVPLRVERVSAQLGGPASPGQPVLTGTSTQRSVQIPVPVDQVFRLHVSDPVQITLPDARTTTPGAVSMVSPVASQPPDQPGRTAQSTVDVTVTLVDPGVAAAYTSAPVSVAVTTASAKGVLAVPVTALLARPGGQFAVTVVDGDQRREVPVTPGVFADTLVEVTGLSDGDVVEVPSG